MINPPPFKGSPAINRQIIETGAVDDHPGMAHCINQWTTGGIAQYIDFSALGAIHERLTHITIYDQFAALHNLAKLILGIPVNIYFQPIDTRSQVISGTVINIDPYAI